MLRYTKLHQIMANKKARLAILADTMYVAGYQSIAQGAGVDVVGDSSNINQAELLVETYRPSHLIIDASCFDTTTVVDLAIHLANAHPNLFLALVTNLSTPTENMPYFRPMLTAMQQDPNLYYIRHEQITPIHPTPVELFLNRQPYTDADLLIHHTLHPQDQTHLTPKQKEVLALMTQGHTNNQIAYALGVSASTIKNHFGAILSKLGAKSRTEATSISFRKDQP